MFSGSNFKAFIQRYKHAWVFLYIFIYLPWFYYLEQHVTANSDFHVIHIALDDYIPFIEYFIVPYLLWFAFIAVTFLWFFFHDVPGFYRLAAFLFTGMTVFLLISTFYPNGLDLRPVHFERDNIFVDMVKMLYKADTPTNVLPSIHVFNSIGVCIAISQNKTLVKHKIVKYGSLILGISIVLATMFLKQHSIIDVTLAACMATLLYPLVYARETKKSVNVKMPKRSIKKVLEK